MLALAPSWAGAAEEPGRIVSLAPSITETLFALGAGDRVVGRTDFCDWPAEVREVPSVGSYVRPGVEAVLAREPDLVIAVPTPGNREPVLALRDLGLEVIVVAEGPRLDDVLGSIRAIAGATGKEKEGESLVRRIRSDIAAVERRTEDLAKPRVLMVVDRNPLIVVGGGTLLDELLRLAGGRNVAGDLGEWPRVGVELLVDRDPDVILDNSMGQEPDLSFYEGLGLRAVRDGRVVAVPLDDVLRPGPRIADGVRRLAGVLHPEPGS